MESKEYVGKLVHVKIDRKFGSSPQNTVFSIR